MSTAAKAFISYSWSSRDHQAWVVALAERLMGDGVEIILDKWDLKPGHDAFSFMERIVTDESVKKVIIVCDKNYVEKANSRGGGVGAESQIITPELYGKTAQDKYALLTTELDSDGKAFVPVFFKGRIYIDFVEGDRYETAYDELLRWLLDKPLFVKPKVGNIPDHILKGQDNPSPTISRLKRAEAAIKDRPAYAGPLVREFSELFFEEVRQVGQIEKASSTFYDDAVVERYGALRPYLREVGSLSSLACRYKQNSEIGDQILELFERLVGLTFKSTNVNSWSSDDFDVFKMFCYELALTFVAHAIAEKNYDLLIKFLEYPFFIEGAVMRNDQASTLDFTVFCQYPFSLQRRNQRLGLNRLNLFADLVKDGVANDVLFEQMLQAEAVLYINAAANGKRRDSKWYPSIFVYAGSRFVPFPLFVKCESSKIFEEVRKIFRVETADDLRNLVRVLANDMNRSQSFGFLRTSFDRLTNAEFLATRE